MVAKIGIKKTQNYSNSPNFAQNVQNWHWPKLAHFLPLDKAQIATSGLVCQGAAREWRPCNFVANANDFSITTTTKFN